MFIPKLKTRKYNNESKRKTETEISFDKLII